MVDIVSVVEATASKEALSLIPGLGQMTQTHFKKTICCRNNTILFIKRKRKICPSELLQAYALRKISPLPICIVAISKKAIIAKQLTSFHCPFIQLLIDLDYNYNSCQYQTSDIGSDS